MILQTGINLSIVTKLDANPVVLQATYQLLGSTFTNGDIISPIRPADIVTTKEIGWQILTMFRNFVSSIITVNKTRCGCREDIETELKIITVPEGLDFYIEMGSLDRNISWNIANQELTFHASGAVLISFETFIYFIDQYEVFLNSINQL